MPRLRHPPNAETESRISARLRELRNLRGLSQSEFANSLGVTRARIANTEYGRAPLRYQEARLALLAAPERGAAQPMLLPFNPLWLAGMQNWPIQLDWPMLLPDPAAIGLSPTLRFSDFVSENLRLLQSFTLDSPREVRLPESWLDPYLRHWTDRQLHADRAERDAFTLMDILAQTALDLSDVSALARRVFQEFKSTIQGAAFLDVERWARDRQQPHKEKANQVLTAESEKRNVTAMKMQELLRKVRAMTSSKGDKAKLADALSVPLSRVSEWLSGKYEPNGETTLRLLQWVEQHEAQQKQSAGSVSAPPAPKTQSQRSNEKHSKSGPPKP